MKQQLALQENAKNEDPVDARTKEANKEMDRADDPNEAIQTAIELQQSPQDIDYVDFNVSRSVRKYWFEKS